VDVHIRRLRAKLGKENEAMIGTVRKVGYKFVWPLGPVSGPEHSRSLVHDGRGPDGRLAGVPKTARTSVEL
jgi:DNA-binding winged helix-turn-helix (wHTH) protein